MQSEVRSFTANHAPAEVDAVCIKAKVPHARVIYCIIYFIVYSHSKAVNYSECKETQSSQIKIYGKLGGKLLCTVLGGLAH